jgi:hypothetical protein
MFSLPEAQRNEEQMPLGLQTGFQVIPGDLRATVFSRLNNLIALKDPLSVLGWLLSSRPPGSHCSS